MQGGAVVARGGARLRRREQGKAVNSVTQRVRASVLGVGAPEAAVVGVVALTVFGPKGLAELARNAGKTVRAFQPTIRELQRVSREFRDTLEQEIALDDADEIFDDKPNPSSSSSNSARSARNEAPASSSAAVDTDGSGVTEEMKRKSEQMAWGASENKANADAVQNDNGRISAGKGSSAPRAAPPSGMPGSAAVAAASSDSSSAADDSFATRPGPDERLKRPPPSEEEVLEQNAPGSNLPDLAALDRLQEFKEGRYNEESAQRYEMDVTPKDEERSNEEAQNE